MNKELEQFVLTQRAANILKVFGYFNVEPQHLKLIDYSSLNGIYNFILVQLQDKKYQLTYRDNGETKSWNLLEIID